MATRININKSRPNEKLFTLLSYTNEIGAIKSKISGLKKYFPASSMYVYRLNTADCDYEDGIRYYIYRKI